MSDWNDFDIELEQHHEPDAYQIAAREVLRKFFETNKTRVFFGNQLAVQHEDAFYHWITYRALSDLVQEGVVRTENRQLAIGAILKLAWHKGYRYHRTAATRLVKLVDQYSSPQMCESIGRHGEQMILGAFARRQFVLLSENTSQYGARQWTRTKHNLDFIFERDGRAYGIEVKNTLSYMDDEEFEIKVEMCAHLGIIPVFACRMLPKSWIYDLMKRGGYAMILKYQLYPWTHIGLARRVRDELGLPVDAPRRLYDGTIDRFVKWHAKNL